MQSSLAAAECRGVFFAGFGGCTYYLRCETECEVLSAACEVRSARQFNHNLMMVSAELLVVFAGAVFVCVSYRPFCWLRCGGGRQVLSRGVYCGTL